MKTVSEDLDLSLPGGRLHARRFGDQGTGLVLGIPGLSANLVSMTAIAEVVPMVALDLRGRGLSETTPPGTYGWEAHAADVLAAADALGAPRFSIVGWSMGAFVGMAAASMAAARIERLVLIDAVGAVDDTVVQLIQISVNRLDAVYPSVRAYLELARSTGLISPWSELWEQYFEYELQPVAGGVRARTSKAAVSEDFAISGRRDPALFWPHLTMPVLVVRAARPLLEGAGGHVIDPAVLGRFRTTVPHAEVVEVDANHYGIGAHPDTLEAVGRFFAPRGASS
jgi:pimeloyl-ACP methyl ester carboxylesterase